MDTFVTSIDHLLRNYTLDSNSYYYESDNTSDICSSCKHVVDRELSHIRNKLSIVSIVTEAQLLGLSQSLKSHIDIRDTRIAELEIEIDNLQQKALPYSCETCRLYQLNENSAQSLTNKLMSCENNILSLQRKEMIQYSRIVSLEHEIRILASKLGPCQSSLLEYQQRENEWNRDKVNFLNELKGLKIENQRLVSELNQWECDTRRLEEEVELLFDKESNSSKRATELQDEVGTLSRRCSELITELTQVRTQLTNIHESKDLENKSLTDSYQNVSLSAISTVFVEQRKLCKFLTDFGTEVAIQQEDIRHDFSRLCEATKTILSNSAKKEASMIHQYSTMLLRNRALFNKLHELRGNIRVLVRVRPLLKDEIQASDTICIEFGEKNTDTIDSNNGTETFLQNSYHSCIPVGFSVPYTEIYVKNPTLMRRSGFAYDAIFGPESTQIDIFREVEMLVASVMDGYNVCIFAYGQTGSGKTHTMQGSSDNPGVYDRSLRRLFELKEERSSSFSISISASYLEIYNEDVFDLLDGFIINNGGNEKRNSIRRVSAEVKSGVASVNHVVVETQFDVSEVLNYGANRRATFSTNMNEHSSRSHSILTVFVYAVNNFNSLTLEGKINFVDLAGSERLSKSGAEGQRKIETQNINKSLSALGDVIAALAKKQSHVPYRNSTLTFILQDSLGGDSKTLMITNVAPNQSNVSETVCTLNFANRVKTIDLGNPKRHISQG